jgi:hypothetical protein
VTSDGSSKFIVCLRVLFSVPKFVSLLTFVVVRRIWRQGEALIDCDVID